MTYLLFYVIIQLVNLYEDKQVKKSLLFLLTTLLFSAKPSVAGVEGDLAQIKDFVSYSCVYDSQGRVAGLDKTKHNQPGGTFESYDFKVYSSCNLPETRFKKVDVNIKGITKPLYKNFFDPNICLTLIGANNSVFGSFNCPLVLGYATEDVERILSSREKLPQASTAKLYVGNISNSTIHSDSRLHAKLMDEQGKPAVANGWLIVNDLTNGINQIHKFNDFNTIEYVDIKPLLFIINM